MAEDGNTVYYTSSKKTGLLLILAIKHFPNVKGADLPAYEEDVTALTQTFENLNFEVKTFRDLSATEMRQTIIKAVKGESLRDEPIFQCPIKDAGCFAVAIMTHGGKDGKVYGSDCIDITINELTAPMREEPGYLFGKPKLVIIQACRGLLRDPSMSAPSDGPADEDRIYRLPTEADFLYAYSTVQDYVSMVQPGEGSWFIQSLCKCFDKHPKEEVLRILTRVNRMVAIKYEHKHKGEKKKQMPSIVSQLTKELYFKPSWPVCPLLVVSCLVIVPVLSVAIYRAMF